VRLGSSGAITSGSGADITITTDSLNFVGGSINSGAGTTTIRARTPGTRINLGGADVLSGSPLTLGLTDAELDCIAAGTLIIGKTNGGAITVSAAITRPASTAMQLISSGDVIISGGQVNKRPLHRAAAAIAFAMVAADVGADRGFEDAAIGSGGDDLVG